MRSEVIDRKKNDNGKRERERKKELRQKEEEEEEAITHYLQIIQFFLGKKRVKNSEINRLRKQNNRRTIMISAEESTVLVLPRNVFF
jgi:hypothetical protein